MKKMLTTLVLGLTLANTQAQDKQLKAYMVADAHLDTQWNWDVQATIKHHIWTTLNQNFRLFLQYPDYIFNFEGGVKYAWMKEYYPLQYEQLKRYIAQGRWHIAGSSWDACETIVCSPESWLRNVLLGQTFYRKEFGKEGTDIFLTDCFGFPYTQPTLMAHCGLIGFSSQKLMWRTKPFYDGNKKYPFTIGLWQGIDGSRVMMVHGFNYSQRWDDADLSKNEMLIREIGESPLGMAYRYYGTGDIGGSPNIASVRALEKGIKGDGPVQIISATSDQLYKDFMPYDKHPELPLFDGELTMDLHGNACYTSQAAMKLYNRQNEHLGDAAERSAVMADWLGACRYPIDLMTAAWQRTIWHQFHDDVTGTSLPRAYEFSWNDELISLKQFADVLTTSIGGVARQLDTSVGGTPVVVYNNETFPVSTIARIQLTDNKDYQVNGPDGKRVASQVVEQDGKQLLLFEASVPATGMAVYSLKKNGQAHAAPMKSTRQAENSRYRLSVDEFGDIESLYDKQAQRELVAGGGRIRLVVLDDCSSPAWPAWEIQKATLDKAPAPVHDGVKVSLEPGSLRQTLVVRKKYGESDIIQRIHLYEGPLADRIDFETQVDWRSENALLKAEFPLSVSNAEATYDLGLGSIRRDNNRDNQHEVYSHEWTDLTDRSGSYGVTILNDSRYGWDKPADNTLRLSLLYSPKPDRGFRYQALQDMGHHVFTYSIIGHQGQLNPVQAVHQSTMLNSPLKTFFTPRHKGTLGRTFSFVQSDNDCVLVRALKRAEVTDEYVVRVYEIGGQQEQKAQLTFAADIESAVEADGTEKSIGNTPFAGRNLSVSIRPNSVKTYKVKLRKNQAHQHSPAIAHLSLPFDRQCFTFNEFRSAANFEGGYTYAAELLPSEGITVDGIHFQFGEKDGQNGLSCRGQAIQLPADRAYTHLYLLAASDKGDRQATFTVNAKKGSSSSNHLVPFYSGFIGQWGHDGHTTGYLKKTQVAYIGTHRHSAGDDEPYEFTYMFKLGIDIPHGATEVVLPDDEHVVLFAATLADDEEGVTAAMPLFEASLLNNGEDYVAADDSPLQPSLLKEAKVIGVSGETNEHERAIYLTDGRDDTKWCDVKPAPNYIVYDLGSQKQVSRWRLLNAGAEDASYITRTCLLQGRNSATEDWQTLDMFDGNRSNQTDRSFSPASVRYVRLFVVSPTQTTGDATRIYEFELY